jgi:hypothetical protein
MIEHFVQFYEGDAYLVNEVAGFIRAGLQAGDAAIVIATKLHHHDLERQLTGDVAGVAAQRLSAQQYVALDAADTLSKFLVDGRPDERCFTDLIGPIFKRATGYGSGRIRVFGGIAGILSENGEHEAAIRLEEFWNNLAKIYSFSLYCAYPMRAFPKEADGGPFLTICNEHSRVGPAESYTHAANARDQYRTIAMLQQKAVALETEVAHRKNIEKAP